jgi:hypothetical protein
MDTLTPIGDRVVRAGTVFRVRTEEQLDSEYPFVGVSSDGKVTLSEYKKGETFKPTYRPKRVRHNDFVYNPMRVNIGSIGLVPEELDGCLTSPDYVVFRARDVNPEFLLHLLRSPFYRMNIDVVTTGSIRDRPYLPQLRNIRIPDASVAEQAVISQMVRRNEEEMTEFLREIAAQNEIVVKRIHSLVDTSGSYGAAPDGEDLGKRFAVLAEQWRRETGPYSSISRKVGHSAYQQIIAMGEPVLPFILRELRARPAHWFTALRAIAKSPPASEGSDIGRATAAWLEWGRERGYLDS